MLYRNRQSEFKVPEVLGRNEKQANDYRVNIFITKGTNSLELPGHIIITVYPLGTPVVKSVNDQPPELSAYVAPEKPFTVLVIVYSYVYFFLTRYFVAHSCGFPQFAGSEQALLISLGTLVGSIATTSIVGSKGAGDVEPSPRDLILHGGVLALDRIHQLVWTFVGIGIYLSIVHSAGGTTDSLPEIRKDMLELMGLSSLGYLAGKAVRKAGPVIRTVIPEGDGLRVQGLNLSNRARVLIDGKEIVLPSVPSEEMRDVLILKNRSDDVTKIKVTVTNPDGQEANWQEKGAMTQITASDENQQGAQKDQKRGDSPEDPKNSGTNSAGQTIVQSVKPVIEDTQQGES